MHTCHHHITNRVKLREPVQPCTPALGSRWSECQHATTFIALAAALDSHITTAANNKGKPGLRRYPLEPRELEELLAGAATSLPTCALLCTHACRCAGVTTTNAAGPAKPIYEGAAKEVLGAQCPFLHHSMCPSGDNLVKICAPSTM